MFPGHQSEQTHPSHPPDAVNGQPGNVLDTPVQVGDPSAPLDWMDEATFTPATHWGDVPQTPFEFPPEAEVVEATFDAEILITPGVQSILNGEVDLTEEQAEAQEREAFVRAMERPHCRTEPPRDLEQLNFDGIIQAKPALAEALIAGHTGPVRFSTTTNRRSASTLTR
jgi:hypothetical protein